MDCPECCVTWSGSVLLSSSSHTCVKGRMGFRVRGRSGESWDAMGHGAHPMKVLQTGFLHQPWGCSGRWCAVILWAQCYQSDDSKQITVTQPWKNGKVIASKLLHLPLKTGLWNRKKHYCCAHPSLLSRQDHWLCQFAYPMAEVELNAGFLTPGPTITQPHRVTDKVRGTTLNMYGIQENLHKLCFWLPNAFSEGFYWGHAPSQ